MSRRLLSVKSILITAIATTAIALSLTAGASSVVESAAAANRAGVVERAPDWREDYAYGMGLAAMHYAYPWLRMAQVRYRWTMADVKHPAIEPNHALNRFWSATELVDHNWTEGGGPNNDTTYSMAWLLVDEEPMILSIPPIDRYYSFQIAGFDSDNLAYVSELEHGRDGGHYALLPQGWKGAMPEGVTKLAEVASPWVVVVGRTYVADQADLARVIELQKQYRLTPLSQWGQESISPAQPEVFKPYALEGDPLATWKTINRAMMENPPVPSEQKIIDHFRELNIGPGQDVTVLDEPFQRGLARAARDGLEQIKKAQISGMGEAVVSSNGWVYSPILGHAGRAGDFFLRTVHQSYAGIVANDPQEALYYGGYIGSDGLPLSGERQYRIHMPRGSEPPVSAFWSISIYDLKGNMISSSLNRYAIGDRTPDLVRDEQGGLTIALQHDRPADPGVNWLPAPEGPFWLVLRAYQPGQAILDGTWEAPQVITVVQ